MSNESKIQVENLFRLNVGSIEKSTVPTDHKLLFDEAVGSHPFVNKSHYTVLIDNDACVRDDKGEIVAILIKKSLPTKVTEMASEVLRAAPARTSLRANIFGGEAPLSGIAGYYDYTGAPIEFKSRKTSFTCEHLDSWHKVFPLVSYVSELYKAALPEEWRKQNAAVPDVVRIHGSPFSTLTLNQRFRTAKHTDSGDFDDGFGVLAVLEGHYEGLHLGLPDFGVCFRMMAGDVLLFNTHHFHCNTELEGNKQWDRLTCVFYYRAMLGEPVSYNNYERRLSEALAEGRNVRFDYIERKVNGVNLNRPAMVNAPLTTPFSLCLSLNDLSEYHSVFACLQRLLSDQSARIAVTTDGNGRCEEMSTVAFFIELFGDKRMDSNGLPPRTDDELVSMLESFSHRGGKGATSAPSSGGFSDSILTPELLERQKHLLDLNVLKAGLPEALYALYDTSRTKWLSSVKADWKQALKNNPDRLDFTWNNRGPVSTTFFELCDVASQVMLFLLGRDEALPFEKNAFWLSFAAHLQESTVTDLGMPSSAMSMKKLNVKLKDYEFGGTRYFEDQPPEEQQRRLMRQQAAVKARRDHTSSATEANSSWLDNDTFDYQDEDVEVDYKSLAIEEPEANPALQRALAMGRGAAFMTSPLQSPTSAAHDTLPTVSSSRPARKRATVENLNTSTSSSKGAAHGSPTSSAAPKSEVRLHVCGPAGMAVANLSAHGYDPVPAEVGSYLAIVRAMKSMAVGGKDEECPVKDTSTKSNKARAKEREKEDVDKDKTEYTEKHSVKSVLAAEARRFLSAPTLLLWYAAALKLGPQAEIDWSKLEAWAETKDAQCAAPTANVHKPTSKKDSQALVAAASGGSQVHTLLQSTVAISFTSQSQGQIAPSAAHVVYSLVDTLLPSNNQLPPSDLAPFDALIARNVFSHTADKDIPAVMERLVRGSSSDGISSKMVPSTRSTLVIVEPDLEDISHHLLQPHVMQAWSGGPGASEHQDAAMVAGPICLRFAEMLKRECGIFKFSNMSTDGSVPKSLVLPYLRTHGELARLLTQAGFVVHGQFTFKRSLTNSFALVVSRR